MDMNPADDVVRVLLVEGTGDGSARVAAAIEDRDPLPSREIELHREGTLEDGQAALARDSVDLVILDLDRPEPAGLAALERFIEERPDATVPVVVLAGDREAGRNALGAGAQDYLTADDLDDETLGRALRHGLERHRLERQLERCRGRLEEFASAVNHDLQNPLMVTRGRLELVREDVPDDQFETIERNLDRMEAQIADVVTAARGGMPVAETEPVDLATVARTTWQNLERHGSTLETGESVRPQADPERLKTVLQHLFENALQHADGAQRDGDADDDRAGSVTVRVGATERGFYVEDDGPGIPEPDREDVFETGYTTADDGTGMGLTVVRDLATAHGWTVSLVEGSDGGARFEFAVRGPS